MSTDRLELMPPPAHKVKVRKEEPGLWRVWCFGCHCGAYAFDARQAWGLAAVHAEGPVRS